MSDSLNDSSEKLVVVDDVEEVKGEEVALESCSKQGEAEKHLRGWRGAEGKLGCDANFGVTKEVCVKKK